MRFEAWTVPWDSAGFERVVADIPATSGRGLVRFNDFGEASIRVPPIVRDDSGNETFNVDRIISSTTGRLIRVYDGSTVVQEFLAERVERSVEDETEVVSISGGDLDTIFDRVILYPHDYPTSPSPQPDWIYGGTNILSNSNFDNPDTSPNLWELYNDATSGNFTLSDGTDTTNNIAYDATASTIETRLETDIAAITDVVVTGGGTQSNPWKIEFVDPAIGLNLSVDDSGLTGGSSTLTETREGTLQPQGWTRSKSLFEGNFIEFGEVSAFEVSTDQADSGSYSLKIDPTDSNGSAGAQQVVNVKPGATYQASIKIYPTSSTDEHRFVIRTTNEELIDFTQGTHTANTWSTMTISDLVIPDGVNEIIFRIAEIVPPGTNPSAFYVDTASLAEGMDAATVGTIVGEMMDDADSDHSGDTRGTLLTWVDHSGFDGTNDSSSTAWDESLSITLNRGMTYGQVFDKLRDLGYEWRLKPKSNSDSYAAGADTHNLEWYNEDGMGTDYSSSATPAINVGQSTTSGPVVQRIPDYTAVFVEGAGNAYTEDKDSTAETNFGRFEKYFGDKRWKDATTRAAVGDEALAEESDNRIAVKVRIVRNPEHPIPLVSYEPGDILQWQVPPVLSQTARKVRSISWNHGDTPTFDVTGSKVFPGETGGWEALRVLLRKFQALEFEEADQGVTILGGGGGAPTLVVAASDATQFSKNRADFICNGVDDDVVIQAANDAMSGVGGRVVLTEGTFSVSSTITIGVSASPNIPVQIYGLGQNITIVDKTDDTGDVFTTRASGCSMRHLSVVDGAIGVDVNHADFTLEDVEFSSQGSHAVDLGGADAVMVNCAIESVGGDGVNVSGSGVFVIGNHIGFTDGNGITITSTDCIVATNSVEAAGDHGIEIDGGSDNQVQANIIDQWGSDTNNTYDGVLLTGDSNSNKIIGNHLTPRSSGNLARYGINVSAATCDDNVVFANFLGDSSDYGTADSVDSGTGTLTAADDGVIGGQFAF